MHFFAFRSLAKNAKFFAFSAKFSLNLFRDKMRNFREIRNEKNFAKKDTQGFRENIFAKCETFAKIFFCKMFISRNLASFLHFLLHSLSRKNAKFHEKVCKKRTKIFAFVCESFRLRQTLPLIHEIIVNGNNF